MAARPPGSTCPLEARRGTASCALPREGLYLEATQTGALGARLLAQVHGEEPAHRELLHAQLHCPAPSCQEPQGRRACIPGTSQVGQRAGGHARRGTRRGGPGRGCGLLAQRAGRAGHRARAPGALPRRLRLRPGVPAPGSLLRPQTTPSATPTNQSTLLCHAYRPTHQSVPAAGALSPSVGKPTPDSPTFIPLTNHRKPSCPGALSPSLPQINTPNVSQK